MRKALLAQRHYLYVIAEADHILYVKVGVTVSIKKRLATLQVGNPRRLYVKHLYPLIDRRSAEDLERYLHRQLEPYRACGEWFRCEAVDVASLVAVAIRDMALESAEE